MSKKIIHLNEGAIKSELKELVRSSVEETLNDLLEQEAQALTNAGRYEQTENRQRYRSGHYERELLISSGEVRLKMPKLKGVTSAFPVGRGSPIPSSIRPDYTA